ncbi:MAG: salicylate hydroxylase [Alphaproteobacteria bacterium]|nr:MAG: salicylate hydroxylase [Alphaproteobacteria bacterium]
MSRNSRTVLIAGGGITGLTAGLALARAGFRVDLFEQAEGFETIGAGLQLSPNALAVLDGLGLLHRIKTVAVGPTAIRVMSATSGREIVRIPLGHHAVERYGRPYLVIHRADLQQVLASACADDPDVTLHMAASVDDVAAHANGVTALVNQGSQMTEFSGIGLVAADGVWSRLRNVHFDARPSVYSGLAAWRALIAAERLPGSQDMESVQLWLAPNAHAVSYPVRHGQHLNVVVVLAALQAPQGWTDRGEVGELRQALAGWSPAFAGLLDHKARWTRWPLHAAPRLRRWSEGPTALAGDAAHAMLPFAAQGAAMGIEDAAVIARCLKAAHENGGDASAAFAAYEGERRRRAARAGRLALANRYLYHLPRPLDLARNLAMQAIGGRRLLARQDWLYGWKPAP